MCYLISFATMTVSVEEGASSKSVFGLHYLWLVHDSTAASKSELKLTADAGDAVAEYLALGSM